MNTVGKKMRNYVSAVWWTGGCLTQIPNQGKTCCLSYWVCSQQTAPDVRSFSVCLSS